MNLIHNERFSNATIPYIKPDYFNNPGHKVIIEHIISFYGKYNKAPTVQSLMIDIKNSSNVIQDHMEKVDEFFANNIHEEVDYDWLYNTAEKYCKMKAIQNSINLSASIFEGSEKKRRMDEVPGIMTDALSVCFNSSVGHDFFNDPAVRYGALHNLGDKMSFDLEMMNKMTKGGIERKTLNLILGGVSKGKSTFMCSFAAHSLMQGRNVLFITLEMAEERIAEKIDANVLDVTSDELMGMDESTFLASIANIRKKTAGELYIKEYPTNAAHIGHFRALVRELKIKKKFVPDIVIVDYLNICAPCKNSGNFKLYEKGITISSELREFAITENVAVLSATQLNRQGYANKNPGLEDTAESFAVPAIADRMWALVSDENMILNNRMIIKQIKNRYEGLKKHSKCEVGIDFEKSKYYDVDQGDSYDDIPESLDNNADPDLTVDYLHAINRRKGVNKHTNKL